MARPASDIAERIVEAARGRFLHEGVDGAALRQIAKDAGTNIGMVYYYFKTKDDLFFAVVESVYRDLLSDLTQLLATELPEEQRLEALYQRMASISEHEYQVLRLILREALISSTRFTRLGELFMRGHIPIILRCLVEGAAHNRLRADLHPLLLMGAAVSLAIMPQLVRRVISASELPALQGLPSAVEIAGAMSEVLLHGIGGPALEVAAKRTDVGVKAPEA